jgi:hypothetical protein
LGNLTLVQSHKPITPVDPPRDHSSVDELINIIINFIIVVDIVVIVNFYKNSVTYVEGAGLLEFLLPLFFSTGTGLPL